MKPYRRTTGFFDRLLSQAWATRLRATVMALALVLPIGATAANASSADATAADAASTHVYLLRGVLNIFSLGLDEIAAKLKAQGITVTVANYLSWASLADEAAAEYRSGRTRTIILVGHSSGATALPDMAERLDQLGAPVTLAIGLDSVFHTSLSGHVGRYINYYVASGAGTPVAETPQFHGELENIDVGNSGVGHLTIDTDEMMQQRVIGAIDAVVLSPPSRPSVARKPPTKRAAAKRRARAVTKRSVRAAHAAASANQ